jgi:hypothetical protein
MHLGSPLGAFHEPSIRVRSIVGDGIRFRRGNGRREKTAEFDSMKAKGEFDVKITPQAADNPDAVASGLARIALDKHYHGPLEASGRGEMLASGDGTRSGAYVALEKVEGSLEGKTGSFVLMHSAAMVDGVPRNWHVSVVPESGTGQLAGLEGEMRIVVAGGKHAYELEYSLP